MRWPAGLSRSAKQYKKSKAREAKAQKLIERRQAKEEKNYKWHRWFAWYPVRLSIPGFYHYSDEPPTKNAWLEYVAARLTNHGWQYMDLAECVKIQVMKKQQQEDSEAYAAHPGGIQFSNSGSVVVSVPVSGTTLNIHGAITLTNTAGKTLTITADGIQHG